MSETNENTVSAPDKMKRARTIKAGIAKNISTLLRSREEIRDQRHGQENSEDQLIKTLRHQQGMGWNDIAETLNKEHRNRGEATEMTDTAAYSRFVRNTTRTASTVNEIGFDAKDHIHLRNPGKSTGAKTTGALGKTGKKRVKDTDKAKELEANLRKLVEEEDNGHVDLETAERSEQLVEAVAKVERNFWVFVADEMERTTTKMFSADALARRYDDI